MWSFLMGSQGCLGVFTKCAVKIYPHPKYKTVVAWGMSNPYDMQDLTLEVAKQEAYSHTESGRIEWINEAIEQIKEQAA